MIDTKELRRLAQKENEMRTACKILATLVCSSALIGCTFDDATVARNTLLATTGGSK